MATRRKGATDNAGSQSVSWREQGKGRQLARVGNVTTLDYAVYNSIQKTFARQWWIVMAA